MKKIYCKFCGITTVNDAKKAVDLGCDAIGLVLVEKSPRYVNLIQAQRIADTVRNSTDIVILFADSCSSSVENAIKFIQPDILQFHGYESPDFCEQWHIPYWKALPMRDGRDIIQFYFEKHTAAQGYLLDNYGRNNMGGSGKVFQWFEFPQEKRDKLILAGGLNVDNIYQALMQTGALNVDVSSGIEECPGIKSFQKMRKFIETIKYYEHQLL